MENSNDTNDDLCNLLAEILLHALGLQTLCPLLFLFFSATVKLKSKPVQNVESITVINLDFRNER